MHWSSAPGVQDCGGGGPSFNYHSPGGSAGFGCGLQWEGDAKRTLALYQPLLDWCNQPAQKAMKLKCSAHSSVNWKQVGFYTRLPHL